MTLRYKTHLLTDNIMLVRSRFTTALDCNQELVPISVSQWLHGLVGNAMTAIASALPSMPTGLLVGGQLVRCRNRTNVLIPARQVAALNLAQFQLKTIVVRRLFLGCIILCRVVVILIICIFSLRRHTRHSLGCILMPKRFDSMHLTERATGPRPLSLRVCWCT